MAIRCGFFNSINGDRRYSAEDMNEPYMGLVSNGVLVPNEDFPGEYSLPLKVVALYPEEMKVSVHNGRGIFSNKWFVSDSDIVFDVPRNFGLVREYASIIVRIDNRMDHRSAEILLVQNEDKTQGYILNDDDPYIDEYRLASIFIEPGASTITSADIQDTRATDECGFVHGLIKQLSTEELFSQWEAIFNNWFNNIQVDLKTHATLITKLESSFTTVAQTTTIIPINIPQYNQNLDALEVYINGLQLVKNTEYTLTPGDNSKITLVRDVYAGTVVSFVVYKSIEGSEAASVVTQVNNLQTQVNALTEDSGWINFILEGGARAIEGLAPGVRKVGNTVYLRGALNNVTTSATTTQVTICTLPEAYAPKMEHYFTQVVGGTGTGVGYTVLRFKVNRSRAMGGNATIVLNGSTGTINANMTIPISTSFLVD